LQEGRKFWISLKGEEGNFQFWEKLENSIPTQKGQALPQEFPSLCLRIQTSVPVSEFTFRAVTAGLGA